MTSEDSAPNMEVSGKVAVNEYEIDVVCKIEIERMAKAKAKTPEMSNNFLNIR